MKNRQIVLFALVVAGLAAVTGFAFGHANPQVNQDYFTLDRRISQVEQRLYLVDSTLTQLRQQISSASRPGPSSPSSATAALEIQQLTLRIAELKARVDDIECGVVKLDERTLPRSARVGPGAKDSCRNDPNTPVTFANRPR